MRGLRRMHLVAEVYLKVREMGGWEGQDMTPRIPVGATRGIWQAQERFHCAFDLSGLTFRDLEAGGTQQMDSKQVPGHGGALFGL